jgi:hypothetical protein
MKRKVEALVNTKITPTLSTERAFEEQVECSFFHIHRTDRADVVVVLYLVFFPP